jgi:hypothetical protein
MVSESTRDAAGGVPGVEWSDRELHWLRNVSEPVGTYLASCPEQEPESDPRSAKRLGLLWPCRRSSFREATA